MRPGTNALQELGGARGQAKCRARGGLRIWTVLACALLSIGGAVTRGEPHAKLGLLPTGAVRWTEGFLAQWFELCRTQSVPALDRILSGTNYSHFWRNFEIAAGRAQGPNRGAPFNDGECYKWLEAAVALLAVQPDAALARRVEVCIETIQSAQEPSGYLHTRIQIRARQGQTNAVPFADRFQFELYNLGHLMSAAALHVRVTGQTSLLAVAERAAACLEGILTNPAPEAVRRPVCPSHFMGLMDLYRATGRQRWLELARRCFELRRGVQDGGDDNQDRLPFDAHEEALGHAVRANYLYAGAADLYLDTGDASLLSPLLRVWSNVVEKKLYLTGGCGALYDGASPDGARDQDRITRVHQAYGRNYQLPQLTAHCETCANIGWALWNWRILRATGDVRFADALEQALYNSVLSGMSRDGTNFFYTNPLRVTEPLPFELRWPRTRVPFLGSFCCPPNLVRILARSPEWVAAVSGRTVWVILYGGSLVRAVIGSGEEFILRQQTEYPWSGRVRLVVEKAPERPVALRLRIPGWADRAHVRVNFGAARAVDRFGTWWEIERIWHAGDIVDLDLAMEPVWVEAHPWVEETFHQVAARRGPLVYCLESADLPAGVSPLDVAVMPERDLRARWDGRLLGGVVVLEGMAWMRPRGDWSGRLYRRWEAREWKPLPLRLVPYPLWGNRGPGEMSVWLRALSAAPPE
ncbi:MAG: beta-L-arabinofuranosidase domain-containing protein [Limisphaera sp.]